MIQNGRCLGVVNERAIDADRHGAAMFKRNSQADIDCHPVDFRDDKILVLSVLIVRQYTFTQRADGRFIELCIFVGQIRVINHDRRRARRDADQVVFDFAVDDDARREGASTHTKAEAGERFAHEGEARRGEFK